MGVVAGGGGKSAIKNPALNQAAGFGLDAGDFPLRDTTTSLV